MEKSILESRWGGTSTGDFSLGGWESLSERIGEITRPLKPAEAGF
jgi:hypothetical protein